MMKKKFLFLTLVTVILITSSVFAKSFSDVPESHWAYESISLMEQKGILSGYPDGNFLPSKYITKTEFAKILVLSLDVSEEDVATYEYTNELYKGIGREYKLMDVDNSFWGYEFINLAFSFLPYKTEGNGIFIQPNETINREDVAKAIVLALGVNNTEYDLNILNRFSDVNQISEDKKSYVAIAVEHGIMQGNANGTFNPKGYLTRAEVSKLMMNAINSKVDENTLFVVGGKQYKIEEYKIFEKISNFELGDINKIMDEKQKLTMVDNFLLHKIYLTSAINHNITLEKNETESFSSEFDINEVVFNGVNISKDDYIKYREETAIVEKLKVDFEEYYELSDEIYNTVRDSFIENNLYKTYSFRIITIEYESNLNSKEEKLIVANNVINKIKAGEDFEKLAKEYGSTRLTFKGNEYVLVNGDLEYATSPLLESKLNSKELYNAIIKMQNVGITEIIEDEQNTCYQILKLESIEDGFVGEGERELKSILLNEYSNDILVDEIEYKINQSAIYKVI